MVAPTYLLRHLEFLRFRGKRALVFQCFDLGIKVQLLMVFALEGESVIRRGCQGSRAFWVYDELNQAKSQHIFKTHFSRSQQLIDQRNMVDRQQSIDLFYYYRTLFDLF